MWSNVISIGKEYSKEIEYILKKLQCTKDVSYATEESDNRLWIYLASSCEASQRIEDEMYRMLSVVVLSFLKLRFFLERLHFGSMSYAKCALICSMLHFDRAFEENVVAKVLSDSMDYNVDGLYNFRMRALKDAWQEVASVAARLIENSEGDKDVFDIATFIASSDGEKNLVATDGKVVDNITKRKRAEIVRLFDEDEYNLICTIIQEKPCEIYLEGDGFSTPMRNVLRQIARVVEK